MTHDNFREFADVVRNRVRDEDSAPVSIRYDALGRQFRVTAVWQVDNTVRFTSELVNRVEVQSTLDSPAAPWSDEIEFRINPEDAESATKWCVRAAIRPLANFSQTNGELLHGYEMEA